MYPHQTNPKISQFFLVRMVALLRISIQEQLPFSCFGISFKINLHWWHLSGLLVVGWKKQHQELRNKGTDSFRSFHSWMKDNAFHELILFEFILFNGTKSCFFQTLLPKTSRILQQNIYYILNSQQKHRNSIPFSKINHFFLSSAVYILWKRRNQWICDKGFQPMNVAPNSTPFDHSIFKTLDWVTIGHVFLNLI